MRIRLGWLWYVYFYLYMSLVASQAVEFFRPATPIHTYYQFLLAFDPVFLVPYVLNLLSVIVNVLSLFPFFSQISGTRSFSPFFSRLLLAVRIVLDVFGRSFELSGIKAMSFYEKKAAMIILAAFVIFSLPSYVAHLKYALRANSSP